MPNFVFSYRSAMGYDTAADPDSLAAWGAFLEDVIGPNVVDPGWPVFEPSTVLGQAPLGPPSPGLLSERKDTERGRRT
jgi:hypothetical protein